jgi:di/tricarboxylate transporter
MREIPSCPNQTKRREEKEETARKQGEWVRLGITVVVVVAAVVDRDLVVIAASATMNSLGIVVAVVVASCSMAEK